MTCCRTSIPPGIATKSKIDIFTEGSWNAFSIWGKTPSYWLEELDAKQYHELVKEARLVLTKSLGNDILNKFDTEIKNLESILKSVHINQNDLQLHISILKDILYTRYEYPIDEKIIDDLVGLIAIGNTTAHTYYSREESKLRSNARFMLKGVDFKKHSLMYPNFLIEDIKSVIEGKLFITSEVVDYLHSLDSNPESENTSGLIWIKDKLDYFSVFLIALLDNPVMSRFVSNIIFSSIFKKINPPDLSTLFLLTKSNIPMDENFVNEALKPLIHNILNELSFIKRYSIGGEDFEFKTIEDRLKIIMKESLIEILNPRNKPFDSTLINLIYMIERRKLVELQQDLYDKIGLLDTEASMDNLIELTLARFITAYNSRM